ncbi:MAG: hypothetical protein K1X64_04835 [Myxococcaceae bacterium]|nr:hypothetical protein [Myxococcaceae bacterium]
MQRWSYLFVVALFAAACPPLSELKCDASNPCPAGASCNAGGYCVEQGTGGGSGGGGGGAGGGMGTCAPCGDGGNEFQVCVGGACVAKYQKLEWEAPVEGSFTADASVALRAKLTVGAPSVAPWPSVSVKFEKGGAAGPVATLTYANGFYEGAQVLADGVWKATVSSVGDAGLSAVVNFTVDTVAPVLEITHSAMPTRSNLPGALSGNDPAMPTAWKRDETIRVTVHSNENLQTATLVAVSDGGTPIVATSVACDGGVCSSSASCFCFDVDLSKPRLNALRGTFSLVASATDVANHGVTVDGGQVQVTRVKWLADAGNAMVATPAIDSWGNLYAGVANTTSGQLLALSPNGSLRWVNTAVGSIEASPTVAAIGAGGPEVVYFASRLGGSARLGSVWAADGGAVSPTGTQACEVNSAIRSPPTPALDTVGSKVVAVTVLKDTLAVHSVDSSFNVSCNTLSGVDTSATDTAGNLTNMIVFGDRLAYADSIGSVHAFNFANGTVTASQVQWTATLTGNGTLRGLAVHSSGGGPKLVGGGGGPGIGRLFQIDGVDGGITWRFPSTLPDGGVAPAAPIWTPSINDGDSIYFGMDKIMGEQQHSVRVAGQAGFSLNRALVDDPLTSAPVLGSDGLLYFVTSGGVMAVVDAETLAPVWSGKIADVVDASPTLDCNRIRPNGPGSFYVATSDGKLMAILVDARKLKPDAAWPKYQHDSANSGNPDWPLNPGCP